MKVEMFTDGACGNNGHKDNFGGYSAIVVVNGKLYRKYYKGVRDTTNNEMELMGVLVAVKLAKTLNQEVTIYSDSAYVVNSVNQWMAGWASKGWVRGKGEPIKNLEIMQELYKLLNFDQYIKVVKIKGHAGHKFNEMADECAVKGKMEAMQTYLKNRFV